MRTQKKKFTLIELMAVIAILAILSTITFVSVTYVNQKIQMSQCQSSLAMLRSTIQAFYETNKRLPNIFVDYNDIASENEIDKKPLISSQPGRGIVFLVGESYDTDDPRRIVKRGLWEISMGSGSSKTQKMVISEGDWRRIASGLHLKSNKDLNNIVTAGFRDAYPVLDIWNNAVVVRLTKNMQTQLSNYHTNNKVVELEYENTRNVGSFDLFSLGADGKEYDEDIASSNSSEMSNDDVWPEN